MAHELTQRADGKTEMAYVGDVPWHGLGQKLQAGASMATWVEAAGMDWTVRKTPIQYYADRAKTDLRTDDEAVMLVRSDTGARLGIVSPSYNIVQPAEVLEFFRDLTETQGFTLETAGTMFGGRRYWALAKITDAMMAGWDKIGAYLLFTTSADGSFASEARETAIRVVCNNTISMAVAQIPGKHYVKINHRQAFDAKAVKAQLELGAEHFQAFKELATLMTKAKVSELAAEQFVTELLRPVAADADDAEQQEASRRPRGLDKIMALFGGLGLGATQKGSAGTAWGLLNAVTEYVDHHATAKTDSHRLARAWWGDGSSLKVSAFDKAMTELVG